MDREKIVCDMFKDGKTKTFIEKELKICKKTLNKILDKHNINKRQRRLTILEKEKIKELYVKNIKIKEIANKYNINECTVGEIINKNKLNKTNPLNMIKRYNIKKYIRENNETYFIKECCICKKDKKILSSSITVKNKNNWSCIDCYLNTDKINNEVANSKKRITNTTGFIGVCIKQLKGKVLGYYCCIRFKNHNVMGHLYKDETLNNKTLIQAVLDRDIFIIEHKLPHRRNFTDLELFANMEYLAYEQIEYIKTIL